MLIKKDFNIQQRNHHHQKQQQHQQETLPNQPSVNYFKQ